MFDSPDAPGNITKNKQNNALHSQVHTRQTFLLKRDRQLKHVSARQDQLDD
jgi:hypothetical protein